MFRTEISQVESRIKIGLKSNIVTLGSCFAENIGNRLSQYKFNSETNPAGIIFNPISIFETLLMALGNQTAPQKSFLQNDGQFFNYKFHSSINEDSKLNLESRINTLLFDLKEKITQADVLILTLGTAWAFELKEDKMLVANCHKINQNTFNKKLLSVQEVKSKFTELKKSLDQINPNLNILLTVSPVRHTREGLANNSLSKSILRLACHELCGNERVEYFPSFEIVMDDLRDYRFFEKDMIHPNEQAQDYIWEKFSANYLSNEALEFTTEWHEILNALNHRAFHPSSKQHQAFLVSTLEKLQKLSSKVNVENEISQVKKQII